MAWQKIVLLVFYISGIILAGLSIDKPREKLTEVDFNRSVISTGVIILLILSI